MDAISPGHDRTTSRRGSSRDPISWIKELRAEHVATSARIHLGLRVREEQHRSIFLQDRLGHQRPTTDLEEVDHRFAVGIKKSESVFMQARVPMANGPFFLRRASCPHLTRTM